MNFDKEAKSDKKKSFGEIVVEGGGGGTETKTVCQTVSNEVNTKMQISIQCRNVVQSTFQNMLITFKAQTLQLLY